MKLEVIGIPVADVDLAKAFYVEQVGFGLDHDISPAQGMRVVQMTPPGSACSVVVGEGMPLGEPGTTKGAQLVVEDIDAAREGLADRGVPISEIQQLGPEGTPGSRFAFFTDPDGNGWSLQELGTDLDPLVVVVDGDGHDLLRLVLPDDVLVEERVDLGRLRELVELQLCGVGELLLDDLVTEVDALVADVDARARDQLLDLLLALAAERALQQVRLAELRHPPEPSSLGSRWPLLQGGLFETPRPGIARSWSDYAPAAAAAVNSAGISRRLLSTSSMIP